ncbi:MAG: GGDEF domain-containing protein [Halobacteriovoraceae bacterium]|nr:GGDEF domain-containing protein [Halobacteriovoraceae bacterium]
MNEKNKTRPEDSTIILTDIKSALSTAEREAEEKPAALLIVGGDLNGTMFDLVDPEISVGRSANTTIPLEFQGVSRKHLELIENNGEYVLQDCGSKNGTYLNNKKVEQAIKLGRGDIIKIGSIAMKYLPKGDPERLTYDKLNMEANTDGLTKCFNKGYFDNAITLEVKKSKVTGDPLSLILFDIDFFKKLNDNYGHDAGDFVLAELANVIRSNAVRNMDVFARWGGEEFVILLPKTNLKQSFEIAERLRKVVEEYEFVYKDERLPVTLSIGVSDYRKGVLTGKDLFIRADKSVYKSKQNGRNQVNFYRE